MVTVLAIDTAGPRLQLALRAGARLDRHVEELAQGHAERLFPAIAGLLERNGVGYRELERIAVTTGPGSFTGLRIGLSAARGLGLALGIPVIGVPTLTAISLASGCEATTVLLDARRGEAYVQSFSGPGLPVGGPQLLPANQARARRPTGATLATTAAPDIGRLADFAALADPAAYPPEAAYIRDADAKPQDRFALARATPA